MNSSHSINNEKRHSILNLKINKTNIPISNLGLNFDIFSNNNNYTPSLFDNLLSFSLNYDSNNKDKIINNNEKNCYLCLDKIDTYGLLVDCEHSFCYRCICDWRDELEKNKLLIQARQLLITDSNSDCNSTTHTLHSNMNKPIQNCNRVNNVTCPICKVKSELTLPSDTYISDKNTKQILTKSNLCFK